MTGFRGFRSVGLAFLIAVMGPLTATQASVYLTGNIAADFDKQPEVEEAIATFSNPDHAFFWGAGWEVIFRRMGIGGSYFVNFLRDTSERWWLDWYGQAFFISFHAFGGSAFFDPFLQMGFGSAGRVSIDQWQGSPTENLLISIFPMLSAGVGLNLGDLLLAAKLTYTPAVTPPPVTDFSNYPLGKFQVTLSAGVGL